MNEEITRNEIFNDGRGIHLYFNGMIGLYVAYGISAFLLCRYAQAKPSYSEEMQMPVAVINAERYERLEKQIGLTSARENYRWLEAEEAADMEEYADWAAGVRSSWNVECGRWNEK